MEIKVGCKLRYETAEPTAFIFQIEAAKADSQIVRQEILTLPTGSASDLYADPVTLTRKVRTLIGPGPVEVVYEATVGVDASGFDPAQVLEFDFTELPMAAGPYTVDRSEGRFDPKVTLAVHATPWLQPYVTYSESMRAPTVSETLTGGDHPPNGGPPMMFFPNPFLDPEIQKGWEFGANILKNALWMPRDTFRLKADYFTMDIDNYITGCAANAFGGFYFCNAEGTSTVQGVELQGMYDARFFFAGLSYTHTTTNVPPQINGFGAQSFLPDDVLTLTGGLRFLQEKLTVGARGYITSKSYNGADVIPTNGDPNNPYNDPYQLLDLFANYKIDGDIDVGLTVTNVFDVAYTPALTTPGTNFTGDTGRGRTFLVTTRAQF